MTIDLSTAAVEDKLVDSDGAIHTIKIIGNGEVCTAMDGDFYLFSFSGATSECNEDSSIELVEKHEPRHWLKDLPDADLFTEEVEFLASDSDSVWWGYGDDPEINGRYFEGIDSWSMHPINMPINMPTLSGDEWELSKISIDDLRAWQKENKTRGE